MANEKLGNELKALGGELAKAVVEMKHSHEFQKLKKDLSVSLKFMAASVAKALRAAKESPSTDRIKSHLNRVVIIGKRKGMIEARKAEIVAAQKIRQARAAIKSMSRKAKAKA